MEEQVNILIADHQRSSRQGLRALLEFSPFINQIWEARNGEAAINMIDEMKPALVILDLQLPVIGALCVTRWIQQYRPDIKVIILSMYPYYEEEAIAAGADRFLVKGRGDYSIQDEILSLFPSVSDGLKGSSDINHNKKIIQC